MKEETRSMEGVVIRGVSLDKNQAKITLVEVPDRPGVAAHVFKAIADANINVDMIVQNISHTPKRPGHRPFLHGGQARLVEGGQNHRGH